MACGQRPSCSGCRTPLIALGLTAVFIRETRGHAELEASHHDNTHPDTLLTNRQIFLRTSFTEPALSSASQAGLVNNLNFGLSWGLFPILFATTGIPVDRIGILVAVYPAVWGVGQLATGALSDRWGRKHLITAGMLTQAVGLALIATGASFTWWLAASALLGAGTAMVYPTLLAAVGDVAHPLWRARAVGVYRLWRDSGYAAGAIVGGITADLWGLRAAIWAAAVISVASGLAVAVRMYETHPKVQAQRQTLTELNTAFASAT